MFVIPTYLVVDCMSRENGARERLAWQILTLLNSGIDTASHACYFVCDLSIKAKRFNFNNRETLGDREYQMLQLASRPSLPFVELLRGK